jgi:hypothetical protein
MRFSKAHYGHFTSDTASWVMKQVFLWSLGRTYSIAAMNTRQFPETHSCDFNIVEYPSSFFRLMRLAPLFPQAEFITGAGNGRGTTCFSGVVRARV